MRQPELFDAITPEREARLVQRAQDGDDRAKLELMEIYRPAIQAQVRKVEPYYPLDDAKQEANLAFLRLILTHDPEKGRIYQRVKAELANALREASALQNSAFSINPRSQRRFHSILKQTDYDPVAGAELASQKGMAKETFLKIYYSLYGRAPELEEDGYSFYGDGIQDADTSILVEQARAALNAEEKVVVDAAYGFVSYEPLSDAEIAMGLLNKSTSTVTRIRKRALNKMRKVVMAV